MIKELIIHIPLNGRKGSYDVITDSAPNDFDMGSYTYDELLERPVLGKRLREFIDNVFSLDVVTITKNGEDVVYISKRKYEIVNTLN